MRSAHIVGVTACLTLRGSVKTRVLSGLVRPSPIWYVRVYLAVGSLVMSPFTLPWLAMQSNWLVHVITPPLCHVSCVGNPKS